MDKFFIGLGIILIITAGLYIFFTPQKSVSVIPASQGGAVEEAFSLRAYANDMYGVTFTYPSNYVLSEAEHDGYHSIFLTDKKDLPAPQNGEGPPGISLVIYKNTDQAPLVSWLKSAEGSNFNLANGMYASTTVSGETAVSYHWSGLYEGSSVAFALNNYIFIGSVTYIAPDDPQIKIYRDVLSSIELSSVAATSSAL